jgi:hypothetical protein
LSQKCNANYGKRGKIENLDVEIAWCMNRYAANFEIIYSGADPIPPP